MATTPELEAVGLDVIINGDLEEITVCLTNDSHLNVDVQFNVHGDQLVTLSGPYDTGSQISFLNYGVIGKHAPHWLKMAKPFGYKVRGAGGDSIPTFGVVTLDCNVAGRTLTQDFVIALIVEPILLGLDFIIAHKASWNWGTGTIEFQKPSEPELKCRLVTAVTLYPGTFTSCRVMVDAAKEGQLLYVDSHGLEDGLVVQGGVSSVDDGKVLIFAENRTDQVVTLDAGMPCGTAAAITEQDVDPVPTKIRIYTAGRSAVSRRRGKGSIKTQYFLRNYGL